MHMLAPFLRAIYFRSERRPPGGSFLDPTDEGSAATSPRIAVGAAATPKIQLSYLFCWSSAFRKHYCGKPSTEPCVACGGRRRER
jgi:hypothetical protein